MRALYEDLPVGTLLDIMEKKNKWGDFVCDFLKILGIHQKIIVQWPCILSLIFLLGRFIYMLIKAVRIRLQLEPEVSVPTA